MKIFFYINTISSGGAERVLTNLATEMSVRGHKCTIVTSFPCSWEYSYGKGVRRISLNSNKIEGYLKRKCITYLPFKEIVGIGKAGYTCFIHGRTEFSGNNSENGNWC